MTSLLPYLLGSTGCLVLALCVAWAFYAGRLHSDREFRAVEKERDEYKAALDAERKSVDEYARTGTTTNQLIAGLVQVATGGHPPPLPAHGGGSGP